MFKKPAIAAGLAVAMALGACATQATRNDAEAVATALFEAFNRHDVEALTALYSEDALYATPTSREGFVDRDRIRRTYQNHFENLPSVHDDVSRMVVDGDTVAVEFVATWDGPHGDEGLPIVSFITVRDGLIVEDITYFDQLPLALTAGAVVWAAPADE